MMAQTNRGFPARTFSTNDKNDGNDKKDAKRMEPINLKFEEDEQKYESKPVEKAKITEEWIYKERKTDKSLSRP